LKLIKSALSLVLKLKTPPVERVIQPGIVELPSTSKLRETLSVGSASILFGRV